MRYKRLFILSIILLALVVGVGFAILTQNTPVIVIPGQTPVITSTCSSLTLSGIPTPVNGTLMFFCGANPAFTVTRSATFTPTYTNPANTQLSIDIVAGGNCADTTNQAIPTGQPISLASTDYFYCFTYTNQPSTGTTIPSFSITWSP
jgi:hypothetical protein